MSEKEVKITARSEAKGDGLKKTTAELEEMKDSQGRVVESSESLRAKIDAVDNISDEARAGLHGLVDQVDELKERASAAAAGSDGLAKSEKKVGTEGLKTARNLDKINRELAEAKKRLQQASVGSADFAKRQKQVTALTREQQAVMRRGAGGTRNFGLAALEASRAVEDLQYGVRGVINNIPQMVLMMGGSAGLTAVISLVAVGLSQLGTSFAKANKDIEFSAESIEGAERRKREALEKSERAIEAYQDTLDESARTAKKEREEIDLNTKSAIANAEAKLKLADSRIKNAILKIEGDSTLSDEEKERRIFELRQRYSAEARKTEEENIKHLQKKNEDALDKNYDDELKAIDLLAEADRKRAEAKQVAEELAVARGFAAHADDEVERAAKAADQRAGKGFGVGEKGFGKFSDKGDQQAQAYVDHLIKEVRPRLNRFQKQSLDRYVKNIVAALDSADKADGRVDALEARKKTLEEAAEAGEKEAKATIRKLDDEHGKLVRNNKALERRLKLTRALNKDEAFREAEGRRQEVEKKVADVRKDTGKKIEGLAARLPGLTDEPSELGGSSKADKEFLSRRVTGLNESIADIVKDGITDREYAPLLQALGQMRSSVSGGNTQVIQLINQIIGLAKGQQKQVGEMRRELDTIGRQVKAQGVGK